MIFKTNSQTYNFKRYPTTTNSSLRAWNAADELIYQTLEPEIVKGNKVAISNDRFGVLSVLLNEYSPQNIITYKSQEKALIRNYQLNKLHLDHLQNATPLDHLDGIEFGAIRVPKSLHLFELLLQQLHQSLTSHGCIVAGFMTRHFSPKLLEIASYYFDSVEQSKAKKKARVLILKGKKQVPTKSLIEQIHFKDQVIEQYKGVFSSGHIDYATQFFLEHFKLNKDEISVLDLASGNGIIAKVISESNNISELYLMDDSYLAIESSKLNLTTLPNNSFIYSDSLEVFSESKFDLIVSNPPFHFGHENNIEVALQLFKGVQRKLKKGGRFAMVTSKHLNLITHLRPLFSSTRVLNENSRFIIYESVK